MIKYLFQDWKANKYNKKGRFVILLFRFSSFLNSVKMLKIIFYSLIFLYRILVEWILGIEINLNAKIEKKFKLFHGQSLVINGITVIGSNCLVINCNTIGSKVLENGKITNAPII